MMTNNHPPIIEGDPFGLDKLLKTPPEGFGFVDFADAEDTRLIPEIARPSEDRPRHIGALAIDDQLPQG